MTLEETRRSPTWLAKVRYITECSTRAQGRRDFAKRQQALLGGSYEPVVERMHTEVR